MAIFLKKIQLSTVMAILLFSCSANNPGLNQRPNCQNNGTIDFVYINIPCESCIQFIEQLIEQNNDIFDYNIIAKNNQHILATTKYFNISIPSIVNNDNITGFQFHPEKSGLKGLELLKSYLDENN